MMSREKGMTDEAYGAYVRQKVTKMTIEKIIKFREASVYKRNWFIISLSSAIISPLFLIILAIVSNPKRNAPNMEVFFQIILLFIVLSLMLVVFIYSLKHNKNIQDKVIDEILGKSKEKEPY